MRAFWRRLRTAPRRLLVVILAVCIGVVGIPAAAPGASSLAGLAAATGQAPAAAPMAELAKRRDPRWPNRIGWQGCPVPIWPSNVAQGAPGNGRRVLVVGDSLVRESRTRLTNLLRASGWTPTVRCWGGKRLDWVSDQISRAKKIDQLPRTVIVVVGTNDMRWISRPVTKARMRSLVKQIGPQRNILWVNTYSSGADRFTRPKERWFNRQLGKLARRNDNLTIIDWSAQARTRGVRFDDGLHYRPKGRRIMAEVIADALNRSQGAGEGRG
ncbi:MAG: hypothetical protein F2840_07035 [Actinobacteria bacterium]|uniref:Unannotated protein n=1 Tax=freshwater metagenome TaxID=449393 RepID=A0A6J7K0L2_9ZZZZ|nr:hypothetical protein [Actinomycetota bacterium]